MDMLAQDGATWRVEFAARSRPLARRWRRQRLAYRALSTSWIPLALAFLVLALLRFTLFDVPGGSTVLYWPLPLWLLALGLSYLLDRPGLPQLARAVDEQLDLEERLSSALELSSESRPGGASSRLVSRLRLDALSALDAKSEELRHTFRVYPATRRRNLLVAGVLVFAVGAAVFTPSPLEAARAERAAVRAAILDTAERLSTLRLQAVERPELAAAAGEVLQAELSAAEQRLRARPGDRAEAVAAVSQAEDRLRSLLPDNLREATAARNAAAADIRSALVETGSSEVPAESSLATAAQSAESIAAVLPELNRNALFAVAGSLGRAGQSLEESDPRLSEQLTAAADALRKGDVEAAEDALTQAASSLDEVADEQAGAEIIEGTLAQLGDGKEQIAQAGLPPVAARPDGQAGGNRGLGPVESDDSGQGTEGAGGRSAESSAGDGAGEGGNDSSGDGVSQGSGSRPPKVPGSGPLGPGPRDPGAASGAEPGEGGAGSGLAGDPTQAGLDAGTGEFEPVYVPGEAEQGTGGPRDSVPGSPDGPGGEGTAGPSRTGRGVNPGAKVPYNEVIGSYGESAAEALDRSALPQDARDYVRDYFNSLVKETP